MKSYCIYRKRIRKVNIPKEFDIRKIQIGAPETGNEAEEVGLFKQGDMVLPCGSFGAQSRRNAYGYTYADKTKQKEVFDRMVLEDYIRQIHILKRG